jgi:hypothetical protein
MADMRLSGFFGSQYLAASRCDHFTTLDTLTCKTAATDRTLSPAPTRATPALANPLNNYRLAPVGSCF